MSAKLKYVRLGRLDEIIIFPEVIEHSSFKGLNPISAGFCYINEDRVKCFGESVSLGLKSMDDDSVIATKQLFIDF